MNAVAQTLADAKDAVRKGWTKGTNARNALGESVKYGSSAAVCWCAGGALFLALSKQRTMKAAHRRRVIELFSGAAGVKPLDIWVWNDDKNRTVEQVLQAFDNAIGMANGAA